MHAPTFLWYDLETFGANPQKDLPCQFAAVRTDLDLNPIGKPINIMSAIANDYLPHPEACLITGITPQQTIRDGKNEADFAARMHSEMATPNTCSVGFNSIRFDDEVTRHMFYRNFYDPYSREWKNGNSRWDIIDLARACYALRPDGIEWPLREDGSPSFKLEHLTQANGLSHDNAHDALSDVYATIGLAKLIKDKQPKLFNYAFSLRNKQEVLSQIDLSKPSVVLHISSKIPASQGCCTWIMPVAKHPTNPNAIIAVDLSKPIEALLNDDAETIRQKLYAKSDELESGDERPGLKLIHINKSPFVTTAKAMTAENAKRLGLDREACLNNYQALVNHQHLAQLLREVYNQPFDEKDVDIDHALYSGGFLSNEDRGWCNQVLESSPNSLAALSDETQHVGLRSLLFRYRARNYPETLDDSEMTRWQHHRRSRLTDADSQASITMESYLLTLEKLAHEHSDDPNKQAILRALYQYAENL
ncbi:exodeoxyribonuclease I [Alteromonas sp. KUL49]|uniref:exodeoxyribonuclease I n=1 Tax=Alteromonas sp. KUL49 TaxID=2480798 RepID=UPI00102F1280|nr:exodeoxyribonuclease I [Alteromonas sp. KUL49]TAP40176.1 exodeoxyribonuclease I [Alteromonas sp. KUL49]GEA11298.1 exodeoxyribonuclease I [Alteromonas sp. KUL49]